MEIIKLAFIVVGLLAISMLIFMELEVLHGILKRMEYEKGNEVDNRGKFRCTFRDYEHPDAPWGCQYEFPLDDDCDSCPFAEREEHD